MSSAARSFSNKVSRKYDPLGYSVFHNTLFGKEVSPITPAPEFESPEETQATGVGPGAAQRASILDPNYDENANQNMFGRPVQPKRRAAARALLG